MSKVCLTLHSMKNKYNVVDLFAGAGGFGLGFTMAGFDLNLGLEIDAWATETLYENHNDKVTILQDDIRSYDNLKGILPLIDNKADVIIGGPPCQGFSVSGPIKDPNDPRNTLFIEFARWVEFFQPKMFVMENVHGLLYRKSAAGERVIEIIRKKFLDIGYYTTLWELNAANFGVPQMRERIFIVGSKTEKNILPPRPSHFIRTEEKKKFSELKKAITVNEAISDLPIIQAGEGEEIMSYTKTAKTEFQEWARMGSVFVNNHVAMKHTKRMIERYSKILEGNEFHQLSNELLVRKRNGNGALSEVTYNQNYRHLKPNSISPTIPASFYSNFIHPKFPRNITSREAARLQSFPDNYVFKGKRTQISSNLLKMLGKENEDFLSQYNQIGNAVPPLLAKAVALEVKKHL